MKSKTLIMMLFTGTLATTTVFNGLAQTSSIPKGRIFTTDGQKILFTNLTIGETSHSYQGKDGGNFREIPADKVVRIEKQIGSEAGKWAMWLGLSGLVGSSLGVLQAHVNNDALGIETSNSSDAPIIIGLTVASAGIGAAIGSGEKVYETVYTNPLYAYGHQNRRPQLELTVCSYGLGVGLRCRF